MGLRFIAETDLGIILEDDTYGWGWPIIITNPDGVSKPLTGFSDDISQIIDPDTGQPVSGRLASVAIRIGALTSVGLTLPVGIADSTSKPWLVQFTDTALNNYVFKVAQSNPDRTLGVVVLILELYML